jgi:hypothetical protein
LLFELQGKGTLVKRHTAQANFRISIPLLSKRRDACFFPPSTACMRHKIDATSILPCPASWSTGRPCRGPCSVFFSCNLCTVAIGRLDLVPLIDRDRDILYGTSYAADSTVSPCGRPTVVISIRCWCYHCFPGEWVRVAYRFISLFFTFRRARRRAEHDGTRSYYVKIGLISSSQPSYTGNRSSFHERGVDATRR